MDKVKQFEEITKEMCTLYRTKNENYGDSFGESYRKLGPISGITRMYDKMNRAISLVTNGNNHHESLEDTFIDLANYAIMNLIELRNHKE